jgi:tetratricopeptide (TPR) repeat protein
MRRDRHLLTCAASLAMLTFGASTSEAGSTMQGATPSHCSMAGATAGPAKPEAVKAYEEATPPLWGNLGSLSYPITTRSDQAQKYFDQGLKFSVGFNHAEARRAFREAQTLDPDCAMCYWGEALVLGPNINVPMAPEANAPALAALRKAEAIAGKSSDKEKALIGALGKRYSADPAAERATLDQAYADAMAALSDKYPDDLEIAVLAAEAGMDTQPWDYWQQPGGHEPKGRTADVVKRLEGVLAKEPDNAGAIHLYIHMVEASDRPERAESYADRLAPLMPGAGHIVHMPSHIYYRVGRYSDSLAANKAASKVDESYITETGAVGVYPIGYYSHNMHFVLVSAQLLGDKATVLVQADKLDKWLTNEVATAVPIAQPIKAAPYFAWAQYGEPDKILAMPEPKEAPPFVNAMWHYARGIAHAKMKDTAASRDEAEAIERIGRDTDWTSLDAWAVPVRPILEVARNVVLARAAQTEGDQGAVIGLFEKAAAAQDEIPYMEPPYWYYPVRQSLGAALLKAGKPEEAEKQFQAALERERGNAWALYGLEEAAKAKGDAAAAKKVDDELKRVWRGESGVLTLERL